ncbi:MAG: DUF3604 domain-containing protein [Verrucomicrobia bacterium]|nr:DUF3604 domain-containing protein [Verrucomicrobiota bacterium]
MRRSICYTEPHFVLAGALGTWRFIYQTASLLPKGAKLKLDLRSAGRENIDWEQPSVSLRAARNVIWGHLPDGKPIAAKEVETPDSTVPQYEFVLPQDLPAGESFEIVLGAPPKKEGTELGNRAQSIVQRRRQFLLYLDPKGVGEWSEPEVFSLDIRGNQLQNIKVIVPSYTVRNKRFDITIRFEDQFGNLTSLAPEETLIDLSYENLRENLNWKLFVPETGFVILPNLYFNESGIYRIRLENLKTKEIYISSPIMCFYEGNAQLFWGLLHGESERFDALENVENCLRSFRDDRSDNFFATSSFDDEKETSADAWKLIAQNVQGFNEEDRFVSFLGFQWKGESPVEGVRQLIYSKDNKPLLRQKDLKSNSLEKIYRTTPEGELLSIPSFTMGQGSEFDFGKNYPQFETVVEIYNAWGSSECTAKDGNPRPISCEGRKGVKEFAKGSIQGALRKGRRFGFVAGGLDDRGVYQGFTEGEQRQYSPGLTAIVAEKYTREALFQALQRRACYATTGARIILGFQLAGAPMGGELNTEEKMGLKVNRHISGFVAGTAPLKSIELIRCGEVLTTFEVEPGQTELEFTYDDLTPLEESALKREDGEGVFLYYYLRVIQEDEHMAWSSPIWVDHLFASTGAKKKNKGVFRG